MSDTVTPQKGAWQEPFLLALSNKPNVSRACRQAKISRMTAYRSRRDDPQFAAAWEEALSFGVEAMEDTAWDRAESESDTLMIFLLKAHRPEKYRETTNVNLNVKQLSDAELIERTAAALNGGAACLAGGDGSPWPDPASVSE